MGINRNAKTNEIKRAYRQLAKQLHPDVNKDDPTAEDRFRDLNDAYEVFPLNINCFILRTYIVLDYITFFIIIYFKIILKFIDFI